MPLSVSRFRAMCAHLVATCPPPTGKRVRFRRVPAARLGGLLATTVLAGNTFRIELIDSANELEVEFLLLHEYAHVLGWRPYHPLVTDHDALWGVAYAKIWQSYKGTL